VDADNPARDALFGQRFGCSQAGARVSPQARNVRSVPWRTTEAFPSSKLSAPLGRCGILFLPKRR
jgi:hypothetical protein